MLGLPADIGKQKPFLSIFCMSIDYFKKWRIKNVNEKFDKVNNLKLIIGKFIFIENQQIQFVLTKRRKSGNRKYRISGFMPISKKYINRIIWLQYTAHGINKQPYKMHYTSLCVR